ncbi:MAG: hypothetical protein RLZ83_1074 [Pseudomonadota bacterium]
MTAILTESLIPSEYQSVAVSHPPRPRCGWTNTGLPAFGRVDIPKRLRELSNGTHLLLEQPARDELRQEATDFLASISGR